jgi:ABC-type transport system involved in multi-copper enzyme maturation permease subunit
MQRVLAVTSLTWKAAFRYRLFWVLSALLLATVIGLPLLIKDDGSARGFTQILLTYTLGTISALLGLSTLWISCGTLARDIEECQMQVVAVKPIARWQIWLGKWLGLMSINAVLLVMAGTCVYGLMMFRASRLAPEVQTTLRNEVLVARGSAKEEDRTPTINAETDAALKERLEKFPVDRVDWKTVRKEIYTRTKAAYEIVPPGYVREWNVDMRSVKELIRDKPLQLRIRFNTSDGSTLGTFGGLFQVGNPATQQVWRSERMSLAPETFHEFEIPANLVDAEGKLIVNFVNPNEISLIFPLEEGFEVLYHEGSFGPNFARGVGVIFCWMAVLTTLGLCASSFLSFPVAAFVTLALLSITFSSGTMANAVSQGTIADYNAEKGSQGYTPLDEVVIPAFKTALTVINLAKDFSPVDSLSTGRMITWGQFARAFAQMVLLLGGFFAAVGITVFTRRELATAQGTQ